MVTIRTRFNLLISASALTGIMSCSQPSAPTPNAGTSTDRPLSVAEMSTLYDPSSLVEVKTLRGFPVELQSVLGVHATDAPSIADVGEPCTPSDVVRIDYPDRCFLVGGLGGTSALVAYRVGSITGPFVVAARYVRTKSAWVMIGNETIGIPSSLAELKEMSRLATENDSSRRK
jgi:hypothetical protein